jgi:hypothetical protein
VEKAQLLEKNDFSRSYRKGDILVYIAKAYDEESKLHFVVVSIPEIPHLGVVKLQLPILFEYEPMRDAFIDNFDCDVFLKELEERIISNRNNVENQHGEN